jgi:hypothetical protein
MRCALPSRALGPASLALGLLALSGCPSSNPKPSPDAAPANPTMLWLSQVGNDETNVQLVDRSPPPF